MEQCYPRKISPLHLFTYLSLKKHRKSKVLICSKGNEVTANLIRKCHKTKFPRLTAWEVLTLISGPVRSPDVNRTAAARKRTSATKYSNRCEAEVKRISTWKSSNTNFKSLRQNKLTRNCGSRMTNGEVCSLIRRRSIYLEKFACAT